MEEPAKKLQSVNSSMYVICQVLRKEGGLRDCGTAPSINVWMYLYIVPAYICWYIYGESKYIFTSIYMLYGESIYMESQFKCIDSFLKSNISFKTSTLIIKSAFLAVVQLSALCKTDHSNLFHGQGIFVVVDKFSVPA